MDASPFKTSMHCCWQPCVIVVITRLGQQIEQSAFYLSRVVFTKNYGSDYRLVSSLFRQSRSLASGDGNRYVSLASGRSPPTVLSAISSTTEQTRNQPLAHVAGTRCSCVLPGEWNSRLHLQFLTMHMCKV